MVEGDKRYRIALLRTAMAIEMVVSKGSYKSWNDLLRELAVGRSVSIDGLSMSLRTYYSLLTL